MMKENPWPIELQVQYRIITEVAPAPDGQHVVYAMREPVLSEDESKFITHLYTAPVDGGEPRQLTFGRHSNRLPRFSPDGNYLAFLSDRDGKNNIYVLRLNGGEAWALTACEQSGVTNLAWAPDGGRIAFTMREPKTEAAEQREKAKDDPIRFDVDFDFQHLFVVPFEVGPREMPEATQVTTGRFHVYQFDWLPDGERVVFSHRPTPFDESWPEMRLGIAAAAPDVPQELDRVRDLHGVADWVAQPFVSPDGQWIACGSSDPPHNWAFANYVNLFPVNGGEPWRLPTVADEQCIVVGWAADSSAVYVAEARGIDYHIVALPVDGSPGQDVTRTPLTRLMPAANRHGQMAYIAQDFEMPHTVVFLDPASGEGERAVVQTALPEGWPATPFPEVEVVRWQAPDGLEIEGLLIYPLNYEPGTRVPLILEIHGGPAGVYSRQFLGSPVRYGDPLGMAARGYATLRANPRGSSGYGRAFRFANYRDWGGGDYRDLMAGVDYVVERGVADPERLGVMGWSYGGFMTSWIITQTNRFRAACVGAAVTNLMSFTGTADIQRFVPDYMQAEFWEDLEVYRQHSAMFQVQHAQTPALIQHGGEDIRVPVSQGKELYYALKRRGVPVEMVIYPRQPHAIEEPRLVMDLKRRVGEWFERWL